jgi:hypothetical protein
VRLDVVAPAVQRHAWRCDRAWARRIHVKAAEHLDFDLAAFANTTRHLHNAAGVLAMRHTRLGYAEREKDGSLGAKCQGERGNMLRALHHPIAERSYFTKRSRRASLAIVGQ